MASFKEILKKQRQSGSGITDSFIGSSVEKIKESMDFRNVLFKKGSFLNALFPKIKGYDYENVGSKIKPVELEQSNSKLNVIEQNTALSAKNSIVLPSMARDMFLVKQNIIKLVKSQGQKPQTKSGDWFTRQLARENALEEKRTTTKPTPEKEKVIKENNGFMGSIASFLGGIFAGSILPSLIKGGLILGALSIIGKGVREFFENEEFRKTVLEGIGNALSSSWKFLTESEAGKNLLVGIAAVGATLIGLKVAVMTVTAAILAAARSIYSGMGIPTPEDIVDNKKSGGKGSGKTGRKSPGGSGRKGSGKTTIPKIPAAAGAVARGATVVPVVGQAVMGALLVYEVYQGMEESEIAMEILAKKNRKEDLNKEEKEFLKEWDRKTDFSRQQESFDNMISGGENRAAPTELPKALPMSSGYLRKLEEDERRRALRKSGNKSSPMPTPMPPAVGMEAGRGYNRQSTPKTDNIEQNKTSPTNIVNNTNSTISQNLLSFIKSKEGFRSHAYKDHKQYSIGYGTKANSVNEVIDEREAEKRLIDDLTERRNKIVSFASKHGYQWTDNQIDALTSFAHNTGSINQLTQNGKRSDEEIVRMMPEYVKASGRVEPGLVKRRLEEVAMFTSDPISDANQKTSSINPTPARNFQDEQYQRRSQTRLAASQASATASSDKQNTLFDNIKSLASSLGITDITPSDVIGASKILSTVTDKEKQNQIFESLIQGSGMISGSMLNESEIARTLEKLMMDNSSETNLNVNTNNQNNVNQSTQGGTTSSTYDTDLLKTLIGSTM